MFRPDQTRPSIQLSLLGGFRLRANGREVRSLPKKARALLAYLATQDGKPVSREAIADLLWTDRGADQARHSLRQTLLVLRRTLGDDLDQDVTQSRDGMLSLTPGTFDTDLAHLRRQMASAAMSDLESAASLYHGPLLHDFPPIASEFDEWLARVRENVAEDVLDSLGRLADFHAVAGQTNEAIAVVERMLRLDPLREDVHRRLMAAYAKAGRRGDAVRQYHACVDALRHELNVAPSRDTEALFLRIRDGSGEDTGAAEAQPAGRVTAVSVSPAGGPPWIAVLPFRAVGPDSVPDYFAAGLVEDIVCMLAMLRDPVVISANSTLAYRDRPVDPRHVARELGVRYVVSGSIRKLGAALRMVVELAEAETAAVVWVETYDATDRVLFDSQDRVVARIVHSLVPRMLAAELQRIRGKHADLLSSYDLVLRARELMFRLTRESFDLAGEYLRRAASLDPNYSAAHGMLAAWESLRIGQGWSEDRGYSARTLSAAATKAIELDDRNAQALALLGHNRTTLFRQYDEARDLFDRALAAAPNDATAWMLSSPTFAYLGDGMEAIRRAETAMRLSPRDPFAFRTYSFLSLAHYTNGTFEEAERWAKLSIEENPRYTVSFRFAAASLAAMGRTTEAGEFAAKMQEIEPGFRVGGARLPWSDPARHKQWHDHLLASGLPRTETGETT